MLIWQWNGHRIDTYNFLRVVSKKHLNSLQPLVDVGQLKQKALYVNL